LQGIVSEQKGFGAFLWLRGDKNEKYLSRCVNSAYINDNGKRNNLKEE